MELTRTPRYYYYYRLVIAFRKIAIDRQDNVIVGARTNDGDDVDDDEVDKWIALPVAMWPVQWDASVSGCLSVSLIGIDWWTMHGINCNKWHSRWQEGMTTVVATGDRQFNWIESTLTVYWEIKCNKIGWSTDTGQWRFVIEGGGVANDYDNIICWRWAFGVMFEGAA